ncbi:Alpha/Beta hydrolase protein [Fusarium sp. MPI-SDFR-AT-0072]|nr:Alpha/Beta hydrolase protein [Fusarium sp. MPI-SDFR-AT-0072]
MYFILLFLTLLGLGNALLISKPSGLIIRHRFSPRSSGAVDADSCSSDKVSYMPPATAKAYGQEAQKMGLSNDTFEVFEMEVCAVSTSPKNDSQCHAKKKRFPIAIFSSGSGNSRLIYNTMASSLASFGNVVVLIDHPYDAIIVELPDGTVVEGGDIPEDTESLEKATQVRARDISFVISQILRPSFQRKVFKGLPGAIDGEKIIALGHSLGGASSAEAALSDPRIRGGMNLDGRLFEPVLSKGLNKPFMLLGRPKHSSEDATWVEFYKNLKGPKFELAVKGTVHGSFTDYPQLISALDLPEAAKKGAEHLFGSVEGQVLESLSLRL